MTRPEIVETSPGNAGGYELDCADPAVEAGLRAWLTESELAWPGRFRISVTVSPTPPFGSDTREPLRQPTVVIQAGPPSGTVRVMWTSAPAMAVVHPTRPEVALWFSPEAVPHIAEAARTFLLVVLVFVLRRLGWYHVHGAALRDPEGHGWLIAGDSNCGKSTTTALVASRGWGIGTDDIGFLAAHGRKIAVMGFRSRIALRSGGRSLLGAKGGLPLPERAKEGYWPEELGGHWVPEILPEIIAFPTIGEQTELAPMAPRDVLAGLVKWSQWVLYEPVHSQEHLDALGRLANQARCYHLTLGPDLFERPDLLVELARR
ncbi:MAG: hypothetical protein HOP28_03035 [Gemmatimonadales bacterium]|nr:hypothetical protein [Gemmatimonadales bacterium]